MFLYDPTFLNALLFFISGSFVFFSFLVLIFIFSEDDTEKFTIGLPLLIFFIFMSFLFSSVLKYEAKNYCEKEKNGIMKNAINNNLGFEKGMVCYYSKNGKLEYKTGDEIMDILDNRKKEKFNEILIQKRVEENLKRIKENENILNELKNKK